MKRKTPEPGKRYTADEVEAMRDSGFRFVEVTSQDDDGPMFVVGPPVQPEWPPGAELP